MPTLPARPKKIYEKGTDTEILLQELRDLLNNSYFDDIVLTNNAAGDPTEILYKYNSVTLYTVTLTYDGSGFLTRVQIA